MLARIVAAGLLAGCGNGSLNVDDVKSRAGSLAVGDPLPAYSARSLGGDTLSLSSFRGHTLVVHVWAAGCVWCRDQARWVSAAAPDLRRRGIRLVTIALDDSSQEAAVRKAVDANRMQHPVLLDPRRTVWKRFGVRGPPPVIVVDPAGSVVLIDQTTASDRPPPWLRTLNR
jgi:peroxiredoxin